MENERKLASIQKIKKLQAIPDADRIELATILGWKVVVKKGEFNEGDLVIYCEVDSVLPERPEFEFLRDNKFRIRTIMLRGQVSQGIVFSTTLLPEHVMIEEGKDVTDVLGIRKYEPPIPINLAGEVLGAFPSFIPKTDEPRIQGIPEFLDIYHGYSFYISEKVDGTSGTYFWNDGEFGVCSRNWELKDDDTNLFWILAKRENFLEKLNAYGKNIAVQGELLGPGVQSNKYALSKHRLFLFAVFDINTGAYYPYKDFINFVKEYDFETVPIIDENYILKNSIEELVALSKGKSALNPEILREGIILRCLDERIKESYKKISFKVLNPDFLLKFED